MLTTVLLEIAKSIPAITYDNVTFKDRSRSKRNYENSRWTLQQEAKKGTIVVTNSGTACKVADLVLTCAADADWLALPKILMQNVRSLTNAYHEGDRVLTKSDANVGDKIAVAVQPGMFFDIGQQNSTDKQAGWVGTISAGDRLYASCNTVTGAQDGGIWTLASFTNSASETVYCMPIGEAHTDASASTDELTFQFMPQIVLGVVLT